jgi:hypothetical protein
MPVSETQTDVETQGSDVPSHDPVKEELKKEQEKKERTELEKAQYNLKRQAEKLKELGGDPEAILGVERKPEDEVPEWFKREQAKQAQKTSLELAEQLPDEDVKSLIKEYLAHRIVPSGNPEEDFRFALNAVNALRNKQIAEEVARQITPQRTAAGGSKPATVEERFEPTPDEARLMRPPYNVTKEQILAARRK